MKHTKIQLKKSQEFTIKLVGFFLAVVLLTTFALTSGAMNLSASVMRPAVRTETKRPTKPAVPGMSCKAKCSQSFQRCILTPEGVRACNQANDRCISACPR